MKSILLAAAALLASPVIAQTTPPADPAAQTAPADPAMQAPPADAAAPADPAMAAPADPAAAPAAPMAAPAPAGGVTFGQPTVTPPTPAPAEYPVCSKTVKDGCRNRGGK
ncbi:hypothetical protein HMP09_1459 [Sphingomonas sp. HMP9]|uniref:hypothetical protein n=1 Tax=Sphingomonas sp. HMP9 TaxID=1517554 RepID=UPI00159663FE|nr:hypothetical protein [Sphingomonas sp. HMP9]BCA62225.1 hypothetical protein HMP09_1459 [Sphingomonas sp. HMP9]